MKNDLRIYGQEFNSSIVKDINNLTEKINEEKDPDELLKLRLQRLYKGMEINSSIYKRDLRTLYPY